MQFLGESKDFGTVGGAFAALTVAIEVFVQLLLTRFERWRAFFHCGFLGTC